MAVVYYNEVAKLNVETVMKLIRNVDAKLVSQTVTRKPVGSTVYVYDYFDKTTHESSYD